MIDWQSNEGRWIIEGLKQASAGDLSFIHIDGQSWTRLESWQAIDTAPQDHDPVLVWSENMGIQVAFRNSDWKWWPVPAVRKIEDQPTHWQPLPSPPEASK